MVRRRVTANRVLIPLSDPSSSCSCSSSDSSLELIDIDWGIMGKKKSSLPVLTKIATKDMGPGFSLSEPDGSWSQTNFYFVRKDPGMPPAYFYRDLSVEFSENPDVADMMKYDKAFLDSKFGDLPGSGMDVGPFRAQYLENPVDWDPIFRATFHLDADVKWRWPEPGEKIYDRPEGGWVGVWLEHLRSGYGPRCHQFVKSLCLFEYGIPITQMTPNVVKWIFYFLGCCEKAGVLPTFKLFHHLFQLVRSNNKPMFEFRFRGTACGYPSGASKPLGMLPSLKGWNGEFVFLQGVDIRFMPTFKEKPLAMHFEVMDLQGEALDQVNAFCRGLGRQVTREDLMSHKYRSEIGCKFGVYLSWRRYLLLLLFSRFLIFLLPGLMLFFFCFFCAGLPGYNPEFEKFAMDKANASLHAALLGIGQVRDNTKVPGEASGSRTQQEGESTSKAPEVAAVDVEGDEVPLNPRKRNRNSVRQEKFGDWGSDCEVVPSGAHSGKDAHFQPHVPADIAPEERNFLGFLAGLPSQKEWDGMGQSSAISLFEDAAAVYGQVILPPSLS